MITCVFVHLCMYMGNNIVTLLIVTVIIMNYESIEVGTSFLFVTFLVNYLNNGLFYYSS
jgi:hypothetical protein